MACCCVQQSIRTKDSIFAMAASSGAMLPVGFAWAGSTSSSGGCAMGVCVIVEERRVVWVVFRLLLLELSFGDACPEDIFEGMHFVLGGD